MKQLRMNIVLRGPVHSAPGIHVFFKDSNKGVFNFPDQRAKQWENK